jgi:pSer/pThr/pTyr-binding forkhead associated (FHA) protein
MAKLILTHDGVNLRDYPLNKDRVTLGRSPESDIQLDDGAISSNHAVIDRVESAYLDNHFDYYIEDLGSTNGTTVNKVGIDRHLLKQGDVIQVGKHKLVFNSGEGDMGTTAIYIPDND